MRRTPTSSLGFPIALVSDAQTFRVSVLNGKILLVSTKVSLYASGPKDKTQ